MKLYKYCGTNHIIENLRNNQIRMNPLAELNDPFEGFHRHEVSDNIRDKYYKTFFRESYDVDKFEKWAASSYENQVIQKAKHAVDKLIYIASFSETYDSLTMWGHYAEKQKGLCLEFESGKSVFRDAKKVIYSNEVNPIVFTCDDHLKEQYLVQQLQDLCFIKYDAWSYEREWRILAIDESFLYYLPSSLTVIYFGFKTPITIVRDVYQATKHLKELTYYRQGLKMNEYRNIFLTIERDELNKL